MRYDTATVGKNAKKAMDKPSEGCYDAIRVLS
jgi:hypothetical protein